MGWDADLSRASAVTPKWASVPQMGSDQALVVVSNKSEDALPSAALTGLPGSQRSQGRPGCQRRQGTVHRAVAGSCFLCLGKQPAPAVCSHCAVCDLTPCC